MAIDPLLSQTPALLDWYRSVRRPLPWRESQPNPYRVWISEVMSHQSTMATVVPYFQRWVEKFPSLEALARADESEVLAAWAGLGYYSRARNVLKTARLLLEHRERMGDWPQTAEAWLEFPGIGPYSAAAIGSICFADRVLPMDGNVVRVLARFYDVSDPLNLPADRKLLEEHLGRLAQSLRPGQHGEVAQAFMELGSLVCRPGAQAKCLGCPLSSSCQAFKRHKVEQTPRPKERPEAQKITRLALLYRDKKGAILLRKIPQGKHLAGQWELPVWDLDSHDNLVRIASRFDVTAKPVKHLITKYVYSVHKVEAGFWTGDLPKDHALWNPDESPPGTLTTLTRKILLI